jgi:branched-chain amino acid transport system ATP-binding protein
MPAYKRAHLGIGRTFQVLHLFRGVTVLENVLIGYHPDTGSGLFAAAFRTPIHHREEAEAMVKAEELLDLVGLTDRADQLAAELTSGQARLLDLARAMATGANFLLLDEPASGLNTAEAVLLENKLKKISERGITMLLIEHDTRLVFSLCDRVVVLDHGVVIGKGTPEQVRKNKAVIKAYLGTKG